VSDNRYQVITWRGYQFDRYTVAALEEAERLLGSPLTILQGSYNGGTGRVAASAGTHDGGGAVDVAVGPMPSRIVRVLRSVGFAAWHRLPSQGPWGEHIHAILIGNTAASLGAKQQVVAYRNGRDGLVDNAIDGTWHPSPIPTFTYPGDNVSIPDPVKAVARQILAALNSPTAQSIPARRRYARAKFALIRSIARPLAK
jgi:hypothetical protein